MGAPLPQPRSTRRTCGHLVEAHAHELCEKVGVYALTEWDRFYGRSRPDPEPSEPIQLGDESDYAPPTVSALVEGSRDRLTGRLAQERSAGCSRISEQEDPHYHRISLRIGRARSRLAAYTW